MELRGGSTRHKDSRKAPKGGTPVLVENSEYVCGTEGRQWCRFHGTAGELGRRGMTARGVATELVLIHSFIHPGSAGSSSYTAERWQMRSLCPWHYVLLEKNYSKIRGRYDVFLVGCPRKASLGRWPWAESRKEERDEPNGHLEDHFRKSKWQVQRFWGWLWYLDRRSVVLSTVSKRKGCYELNV